MRGTFVFGLAAVLLTAVALAAEPAAPAPAKDAKEAARPTKKFKVDAEKWNWSPDTITVKKGTHVVLEVTSGDASRELEIKDLGVRVPVSQGTTAHAEFDADRVGTFPWKCSRPCGNGCAKMRGKLVVTE